MARHSVRDKVIVITGASSGFGKGAARELARQGAKLVLAARRPELLDDLVRDCIDAGADAVACLTDVSKHAEVERLGETAVRTFGRIDVWINNAGIGVVGTFDRIPLDVHEQVLATDLLGTLYGSYCAYRQFLDQESGGTLINIAFELGFGTPYYTSYTAAKHGVMGLSGALRQEIEQNGIEGIHVCTLMPTAHDTPFFDHVANYSGHEIAAHKPLHDPQHVIDTIVRIAADPKDEEIVGADGVVKLIAAHDMPSAVRSTMTEGRELSGVRC